MEQTYPGPSPHEASHFRQGKGEGRTPFPGQSPRSNIAHRWRLQQKMNLTQMRDRVRQDLKDTDPANCIWTDAEIDGAIDRAVMEYSIHAPIEQQTDIATTSGNRELDISGLAGLLHIVSVEFPIGRKPPYMQHFERYAGRLYMEDEGSCQDARVRWLKLHTLDADLTTIPPCHDEIIVLGATGYLAMSASACTVDRATIAGRWGTQNYRMWGKERLATCDKRLKQIARGNRVTRAALFTRDD